MTDNQINAVIAKACGWKYVRMIHLRAIREDGLCGHPPNETHDAGIPNYCQDLNAMHEAEKTLPTPHHCHVFDMELSKLLGVAAGKGIGGVCEWTWHSTARQRAKAFLRTIGKWVES